MSKNTWGTKDERLRFAAYKLLATLPPEMNQRGPIVINEVMNIIDAALEDDDLNVLVCTLKAEYKCKITAIKEDVMKQLQLEMITLQHV